MSDDVKVMDYLGDQELWGIIPTFLNPWDERDAVTQIDANYQHGGGWHDTVSPYEIVRSPGTALPFALKFEGDPPFKARGMTMLRDEVIVLFDYGYVAVIQKDGTHRVARID